MDIVLHLLLIVMQIIGLNYLLKAISGITITWQQSIFLVPIWYIFDDFALLLVFGYCWLLVRQKLPFETKTRRFFYAATPYTMICLFQISLEVYFKMLFGEAIVNSYNDWFSLLSYVLVFALFKGLTRWLNIDYALIRRYTSQALLDKLLVPINMLTVLYWSSTVITLFVLGMIQGMVEAGLTLSVTISEQLAFHIAEQIAVVCCGMYIVAMLSLSYRIRINQEKESRDRYEHQLSSLSDYSRHIEQLYQEIRSFKHDYVTILSSLASAIEDKDMEMVESIYTSVLVDTGKTFYQEKYEIGNLSHLTNTAIKSVISAKLREAQHEGIAVTVEVEERIDEPPMDLLDYLTLLSVFLENAIEAAKMSDSPEMILAYFKENGTYHLIIENSTAEEKVSITKVFDKGYSTKGENRGLGLFKVKGIVDRYPQISLNTKSDAYRFKQSLEVNY